MPPKRAGMKRKTEDIRVPTSRQLNLQDTASSATAPAPKRAKTTGGAAVARASQPKATVADTSNAADALEEVVLGTRSKKKLIQSKKAAAVQHVDEGDAMDVNNDTRQPYDSTRLHPRTMSEQNLFLIHCRDNFVPGSTGLKDWADVAAEFNERFKDELKKPLAWNTLSKRYGQARKLFLHDNPEYLNRFNYPVSAVEEPEKREVGLHNSAQGVQRDADGPAAEQFVKRSTPTIPEGFDITDGINEVTEELRTKDPTEGRDTETNVYTETFSPGSHNPNHISATQIPPIDRAKYHLRRRTNDPVTFRFLDKHEAQLVHDDPQFVDYDTLVAISPVYAHSAYEDPEDTTVDVRKGVTARTVNAFIQIISPVRMKELPTHYLWNAKNPVAGVYDRFGAIAPEKIEWTVDVLLELHVFAREMEVFWIGDIVLDRIHWMFKEQSKLREACATMANAKNGYVQMSSGREVFVGRRLPSVSSIHFSLAAEDFANECLERLVAEPADYPTLNFIADIMHALGGKMDTECLSKAPPEVQAIFTREPESNHTHFTRATKQQFCTHYHHHAPHEPCYIDSPDYPARYFINHLYTSSSHNELVSISDGLSSTSTLASILYAQSGAKSSLKSANSTSDIVSAEKMVLEMEMRLEEAKKALAWARDASGEDKAEMISEGRKVVEGMYMPSRVLRKRG